MITVHHLQDSRSQRVLWLLEELGLAYEVRRYERTRDYRAPPELKAVHPLGRSPVIEDGSLRLAETGAIVNYVIERHANGRLMPQPGSTDFWTARHFLHHAEGTAMPPLVMRLVFNRIAAQGPRLVRPIIGKAMATADARFLAPQIEALLDYWEGALAGTGWFAGPELSAADIMMSFPVEAGAKRLDYSGRPRLRDFVARIQARPAYRRALERGGPYAYA
ncbi:glutathione S-transferase family protein [Antarcticirhabdus aurantiaca]|uniref:Glutathione S-transferase n=1 Tax=Antarcticirhabdus aurantiaca TaxID=2606717 RepID=A0ACD4NM28_9HYPH|nr:glutathione S-transferase [Antarcticirhabdus aurantiaca]WAJ27755.1 glutathione S-transferase [Jeongeuplla avenae]